LANLKITVAKSGDIHFLLSGKAYANGTAYNKDIVPESYNTARIYDDIYVRHWDTWLTPEKYALFSGVLKAKGSKGNSNYFFNGKLHNLSNGIKGLETPVQPFGGSGDYAITPDGKTVAFLSKDPELPQANFTASYIYLVPHDGSLKPKAVNSPKSRGTPKNARGASANPVFSPDGKTLAYFQMDEADYESDKNKLYTTKIGSGEIKGVATNWDRSPTSVSFSKDGKSFYLIVGEHGRFKVFFLPVTAGKDARPIALTEEGTVGSLYPISKSSILVSNSSIISSTGFAAVDIHSKKIHPLLEPQKVDLELSGLHDSQVSEFWYQGNWTKVHGWVVKPSNYNPRKKYPLSFLIHGGPQDSWRNAWNLRWNAAVFADQGYIVVAINPTGSTGYGKKFTDAIQNNWGAAPYDDLVKGFDYVAKNFHFIDTSNAVAAGASYGGYMCNWIQGQPFGRKFKALVTHDGVFSTADNFGTDELWFIQHDFNGTLWGERGNYERWDPSRFIENWATPHFVIHNELDYRLPISEGISLFNVLQEKGVPSRFLSFPDENHFVLKPENSLVWHREVLGWLNRWSGVADGAKL
jgi:dipeptidyl aminopeptidase/acylaminoacyl peptidase